MRFIHTGSGDTRKDEDNDAKNIYLSTNFKFFFNTTLRCVITYFTASFALLLSLRKSLMCKTFFINGFFRFDLQKAEYLLLNIF